MTGTKDFPPDVKSGGIETNVLFENWRDQAVDNERELEGFSPTQKQSTSPFPPKRQFPCYSIGLNFFLK